MSVTSDILLTYRRPRQVMRRHLAAGVREDRALAFIMIASVLIFVAQWPRLAREAHLYPDIPLDARLGGALMATIFLLPLISYGIAALAHLVARAFGGRGSFYSARLALFWSMLAISPLMLLQGIIAGLSWGSAIVTVIGLVVLAVFLMIWISTMTEAETARVG